MRNLSGYVAHRRSNPSFALWSVTPVMGLFYTNLTVYRPERQALIGALRGMRREAFVSPTVHGYTVVFD